MKNQTTPQIIDLVKSAITEERILMKKWDRLHYTIKHMVGKTVSEANGTGGYSLSDSVRIAKAAARRIKAHRETGEKQHNHRRSVS